MKSYVHSNLWLKLHYDNLGNFDTLYIYILCTFIFSLSLSLSFSLSLSLLLFWALIYCGISTGPLWILCASTAASVSTLHTEVHQGPCSRQRLPGHQSPLSIHNQTLAHPHPPYLTSNHMVLRNVYTFIQFIYLNHILFYAFQNAIYILVTYFTIKVPFVLYQNTICFIS